MLSTTPAIEDMLDKAWKFVEANKNGQKCFNDWTEEEIKNTFRSAIFNKAFMMCSSPDGKVIGIVHGINDHKRKLFHVSNILTTHNVAIRIFLHHFDSLWPGYSLAGNRYGKLVNYNTPKLKRRLARKDYV